MLAQRNSAKQKLHGKQDQSQGSQAVVDCSLVANNRLQEEESQKCVTAQNSQNMSNA